MKGMVFGWEVNRRAMHLGKASLAVVGIVLVYLTVLTGTGGTEKTERVLPGSVDSPELVYPEIVDKVVEDIWSNCGLDLKDIKEVVKSLDFSVLGVVSDSTDINMRKELFARSATREFITLLSPELKHMLLDCLTKQNFHFCSAGDDRSMQNRYTEYLESLYGWNPFSRRHLAGQPVQVKHPASVKAPAPPPVPAPALLPSTAVMVEPSSEHASTPAEIIPDPSPTDFLQPKSPDLPAEPGMPSRDNPPVRPSKNESKSNQGDSKSSVVIAVVVAGVGITLLVACLCCYYGCLRDKQGLENVSRDDRPLLSLSISDFSGSSHKSLGDTSLVNKDKLGVLSFKSDRSQSGRVLSLNKSNEAQPTAAFQGIAAPSVELSSIPCNNPVTKLTSVSATEQSGAPNNTPAPKTPPLPPLMPPPIKKVASPPPAPPPPLPNLKPGSRPPPPPKGTLPPRAPQSNRPSPLGSHQSANASVEQLGADDSNAPRTKLKPFFWDKVSTNSDQSMVWDQIKSGSFQFNEEMIETLFGYSSADKSKNDSKKKEVSNDSSAQYIQLIDKKKSQNLAILLKALNVKIEEVCDALSEGNKLPAELLQNLLRMAPTTDEELKLRLYNGNLLQLGPAEQFLKAMIVIPFAFKRMDALLFMSTLEEEASSIKESFAILQVACQELRSSRLFLKLLEAVLKTGNRMNDGTFRGSAQAFKLDTLLKLSDVKGIDGKTTLLHFVVKEIIRSEGLRAIRMSRESGSISSLTVSSPNYDDFVEESPCEIEDHYRNLGLKVVSGLGNELENVKRAAGLDADALTNSVASLGHRLVRMKEFLNTDMQNLEESGFHLSLKSFLEHAEADITSLLGEEKRIRSLAKSTTDYFHGNAGKDEGLHLFVIVRNFLGILDKVCKEVKDSTKKVQKVQKTRDTPKMAPAPNPKQMLFPAIRDRRMDSSSSDDEGP